MKIFLHSGLLPAPSCYAEGYAADLDEYIKLPRVDLFRGNPAVAGLTISHGFEEYYNRDTDQIAKDMYNFVDFVFGCALHHYLVHKELPDDYGSDFSFMCGQGEGIFLDKAVFVHGVLKALILAYSSFRFGGTKAEFLCLKGRGFHPVLSNKGKSVLYDKDEYESALKKIQGELYNIWALSYECTHFRPKPKEVSTNKSSPKPTPKPEVILKPHPGFILTNKSLYDIYENGEIIYLGEPAEPFNIKTFSNLMKD